MKALALFALFASGGSFSDDSAATRTTAFAIVTTLLAGLIYGLPAPARWKSVRFWPRGKNAWAGVFFRTLEFIVVVSWSAVVCFPVLGWYAPVTATVVRCASLLSPALLFVSSLILRRWHPQLSLAGLGWAIVALGWTVIALAAHVGLR